MQTTFLDTFFLGALRVKTIKVQVTTRLAQTGVSFIDLKYRYSDKGHSPVICTGFITKFPDISLTFP